VAVTAANNVAQFLAVSVLRQHGARDIEQLPGSPDPAPKRRARAMPAVQYPLPL
jgi:hypothetical protein